MDNYRSELRDEPPTHTMLAELPNKLYPADLSDLLLVLHAHVQSAPRGDGIGDRLTLPPRAVTYAARTTTDPQFGFVP